MNPSTALARVLLDELIANGVTDVVLCPGSRNAPLSMALHDADATGALRLHVRIDERTAGFLALGLARGSGRPGVVVTTSGTAVANLHPAVLEAHHGGVPLLVLSADRPPELRDVGANQTVDQRGLFGPALRFFHEFGTPARRAGQQASWRALVCRALAACRGAAAGVPGPVQLNVPLAEPLLPDDGPGSAGSFSDDADWPESLTGRDGPWTVVGPPGGEPVNELTESSEPGPDRIEGPAEGEKLLFVADLTHPLAGPLAARGQLVLAEAGGAAGAAVLSAGVHLLAAGLTERLRPDRVVVLGRPTLFREVAALLADPGVVVDVVAPVAGYADPAGRARRVAPTLGVAGTGAPEFAADWRAAQQRAAAAVAETMAGLDLGASPRLAAELVAALPVTATLVLGSSQVPRDVGQCAAPREGVHVVANRGVAGIDGTVSTSVGVALAGAGPTVALLGDLTFVHDLTGLIIGPHELRPDLTVVVSNNDGGGIFATLEPGHAAHSRAFERVFATPHGVDLAALAAAVGAEHQLITTTDELSGALADPGGIRIVEVPTSRTELSAQYAALRTAVAQTLA